VEAVGVETAIKRGMNDLKVADMVYHSGNVSGTYTKKKIVLTVKSTPPLRIDPLVVASIVERINRSFLCQKLVQGRRYYV
ncbi:hypothetical protein Tco_1062708, partial [Tanacetum coccineum]